MTIDAYTVPAGCIKTQTVMEPQTQLCHNYRVTESVLLRLSPTMTQSPDFILYICYCQLTATLTCTAHPFTLQVASVLSLSWCGCLLYNVM